MMLRFGLLLIILAISTTVQAQSPWQPTPGTTWQWQLRGTINTTWNVQMYDVDLFDTPQTTIDELHTDGRMVICYFSAGSHEDWRSDAATFPAEVLGDPLDNWPGERWLDISRIDLLTPIMTARLDLAVSKACDGVEPDNVDGYANDTGFNLSYDDQIAYNTWMADQAHTRNLSIGLKNDLAQVEDLVDHYDWAINEQCFQFQECELLLPFIQQHKAVFGVEYQGSAAEYCPKALGYGFSWLTKTFDLDDEPPGACVERPSPANATPLPHLYTTATPTITWNQISWATGYQVQVALDTQFNYLVGDSVTTDTLSFTTAALANARYYWRVRAFDGTKWGDWSSNQIFTIAVP